MNINPNQNNFLLLEKFKELNFLNKINYYLRSRSVIYVFIKGYIFNTREYYYQNALVSYTNSSNLNIMEKVLKDIQRLNKNNNIIFLKIPYYSQISDNRCKSNDLGEIKIIKNLKNFNFQIIDFKPIFCEYKKKEKIFLKLDGSHLSEFGHKIVAKNLEGFLD